MGLSFKINYLDLLFIKVGLSILHCDCLSFFSLLSFLTKEVLCLSEFRLMPEKPFLSFFFFSVLSGNISDN